MQDENELAIRELVAEWMRRSRLDLAVTQITEDERIAPEIVAFHAQQAAEKALKAVLVFRQVEFPRTHNVALLVRLCQETGAAPTELLPEANMLTRYAVAARYPGEDDPISQHEARRAGEMAARFVTWVENYLAQAWLTNEPNPDQNI